MVTFNWKGAQHGPSSCPVCGSGGAKHRLIEIIVDRNLQSLLATDFIALLRCPACDACYCDPLRSIGYETADAEGLKYYIEQGAGVDVMLEPLSLVDGRPIRRFLEIGCGFGFAMDYARRMLGWEVRGFDPGFIAATGKELLDLPIENVYLDAESMGEGEADLVLGSEVIEHIVDPNNLIRVLRRVVGDKGLLLLTTPNSEALSPAAPQEVILPILSPGHHVILYNPVSIKTLLRRNGFDHVLVVDRGNQLHIAASAVPLSGTSSCFTRALYRRYLEMSVASHSADNSLGAGYAYRLLKEHVNAGRYDEAANTSCRLRDGYRRRYDLDINRLDAIFPSLDSITFKEFGEQWPYNLCGVWYYQGLIELLDQRKPALAAPFFGAALSFGAALRRVLHAIGTDDLETANLCREAEIARLSALSQYDISGSLEGFQHLSRNPSGLDPLIFEAHFQRARHSLFIDLVNLGHYAAAKEVVGSQDLPIGESMTSDEVAAAFAWGLYLLNDEGEFTAASGVLARVCQAAAAVLLSRPDDGETACLFREAEVAWIAALARYDAPQALAAFEQLSRNLGGLDPATFAMHLERARRSLFIDLVNLEHYTLAKQFVGSKELPIGEPITSDGVAAAFAWGLYLLNDEGEFAAASAVFARVREACVVALLSVPDEMATARILREAEIARLTALARYDPTRALSALQQLSRNEAELDAATFAAHLTRAGERLFMDLVNLGHCAIAEEVMGSQKLPNCEPITYRGAALAFACGVYLLNHKSEFAEAGRIFGQVWEAARARATDRDLLWPARFHQALASRYRGDWEAARLIAEEISDPPQGLPLVPDEYQQRLGELVAPSP